MKFSLAIAALLCMTAQSVRVTRDLPSTPAYPAEDYNFYSSTEIDNFNNEVNKAKIDTMLYQAGHQAEFEEQKEAEKIKEANERE